MNGNCESSSRWRQPDFAVVQPVKAAIRRKIKMLSSLTNSSAACFGHCRRASGQAQAGWAQPFLPQITRTGFARSGQRAR